MQIINPTILITPASFMAGGPVDVEVTYVARFTPMEKLLASYGLSFRARILLYEVDSPDETLTNDDYILTHSLLSIPASEIVDALGNDVFRSVTNEYDRPELRGPNDDNSEYWERIRARIHVWPIPSNSTIVESDQELSNHALVNTQGPTLVPG